MNDMQLFTFENQKVRTVTVDGEPYFAGKDVAIILGYGNPTKAIRTHVDEEDKGGSILDTPGGKQRTTMATAIATVLIQLQNQTRLLVVEIR